MKRIVIVVYFFVASLEAAVTDVELRNQYVDHTNSLIMISQQDLLNNDIVFESKLMQGAKDGIFYVEIPAQCNNFMSDVLDFGNSFYQNDEIKKLLFSDFSGYHKRENVQVESFYLERIFWKNFFLEPIYRFASHMNSLSECLLKKILYLVAPHIVAHQLSQITGKVTDNKGQYYFMFNYYRPEKNTIGFRVHKDTGFITLLYINKPGFIAYINDSWGTVFPKENYFVVNLGQALEILVNTNKVTAVLHAVEQVKDKNGRISFGLSIEGDLDSPVYQLSHNGLGEEVYTTYRKYIEACFKQTFA
jgi:hypothetical protein